MKAFINLVFWASLISIGLFCTVAMAIGVWHMVQWSSWTLLGLLGACITFGASGYFKVIFEFIDRDA